MKTETESLPWSQDIWDTIHKAVYDEMQRVVIAPKFLPLYGPHPRVLDGHLRHHRRRRRGPVVY